VQGLRLTALNAESSSDLVRRSPFRSTGTIRQIQKKLSAAVQAAAMVRAAIQAALEPWEKYQSRAREERAALVETEGAVVALEHTQKL
jgi:hypothetical protein